MHNLVVPATHPSMDTYTPEFCFCGRKVAESHESWFCSTECARQDSLRSLDDPECHYRNVVRKAYVQAGVPELYPRRMMSASQLCSGPSQKRGFVNAPSPIPLINPSFHSGGIPSRRAPRDLKTAGFPTLSQVAGRVLTGKPSLGEALRAERRDRPRFQGLPSPSSRANPTRNPHEHIFEPISLDAVPLPEHIPVRPLRHTPSSGDLRANFKKSVTALLNVGKSRKDKEAEKRVFGHPVNTIIPPVRKESLPSYRQRSPPAAIPEHNSKALRRSASFASSPHGGRPNEQDTVTHIRQEMKGECHECFDPRALFACTHVP